MLHLHAPIVETRTLHWTDESTCSDFATRLAQHPELANAFLALHGPLGAGKTTFVRFLLRALGAHGRIKSPTYAVLETYELTGMQVAHFDFYRFEDPREWLDAGFRELFSQPGLKLAEWPEKAAGMLPRPDLDITIEPLDGDRRRVTLATGSALGSALLR